MFKIGALGCVLALPNAMTLIVIVVKPEAVRLNLKYLTQQRQFVATLSHKTQK
jgi:hypothetical protein